MSPDRLNRWGRRLLAAAFWLAVWELASLAVGLELLLPSPRSVAVTLAALAGTADFWLSVGGTLLRVFAGLMGGAVLGGALAFLTHFCPWADVVLSPAIRVIRATPVVSFILLVYLWVTRTNIPGVIAAAMVMPVVWGSLTAGLEAVDGGLLELARAYRFSGGKTLRLIYLPALRPYFSAGFLTAVGLAWKSGVAAEVICPPKLAIGTQIYQAKLALETPELFAWTLTIIVLSLLLEALARRLLAGKGAGT